LRREWNPDDLIACWTLGDSDWPLIANTAGATRLGPPAAKTTAGLRSLVELATKQAGNTRSASAGAHVHGRSRIGNERLAHPGTRPGARLRPWPARLALVEEASREIDECGLPRRAPLQNGIGRRAVNCFDESWRYKPKAKRCPSWFPM
jgi:hypothetical protein